MAKARGTTFRFYGNTGPVGTPVYTALDCEGTVTLSINHDTADTTGKCLDWKTALQTVRGWSVSGSGHYEAGDSGVDELRDNIMAGDTTLCQIKTFNAEVFSGELICESFEITASYDGVVDFSFSGTGTGALAVA